MRELRVVGVSADGTHVICQDVESGERFGVPSDERLRAAARGDISRLGQIEIEMQSALRPREIQARIRAGASVAEVATIAGVGVEKIERFAHPVLLERTRAAELAALAHPLRHDGPSPSALGDVVGEALFAYGQNPGDTEWDAWKGEDGFWVVQISWQVGHTTHHAHWRFHPGSHGGTATPLDELADELTHPELIQPRRRLTPVATPTAGGDRDAVTFDANDLIGAQRDREDPYVLDFAAAKTQLVVEDSNAQRIEAERIEAEHVEAERAEAEAEQRRAELAAAEEAAEAEARAAAEAEAQAAAEAEAAANAKAEAQAAAEAERIAAEKAEAEKAEAEKAEAEKVEAEKAEAEKAEAEKVEAEKVEAEKVEAERLELEQLAAEIAELERLEQEAAEAERVEAERAENERAQAERAEADRLAKEQQAAAEAAAIEKAAAEKAAAEKAAAEKAAAEAAEAERAAEATRAANEDPAPQAPVYQLPDRRPAADTATTESAAAESPHPAPAETAEPQQPAAAETAESQQPAAAEAGPAPKPQEETPKPRRRKSRKPQVPAWEDVLLGVRSHPNN